MRDDVGAERQPQLAQLLLERRLGVVGDAGDLAAAEIDRGQRLEHVVELSAGQIDRHGLGAARRGRGARSSRRRSCRGRRGGPAGARRPAARALRPARAAAARPRAGAAGAGGAWPCIDAGREHEAIATAGDRMRVMAIRYWCPETPVHDATTIPSPASPRCSTRAGAGCPVRSHRDVARHLRRRRPAVGAHRAAARLRRARLHVLHELREPQGPGHRRQPARRADVLLAVAGRAGAGRRHAGADRARGIGRLLRDARARPPGRGVGLGAEPAGRVTRGADGRRSPRSTRASPAGTCRGRRTGAAIGSRRRGSSSGRTAPSACTTASSTSDRATAGR